MGENTWCELLKLKPNEIEIVTNVDLITKTQVEAICGRAIQHDALDDLNSCLQRFEINTLFGFGNLWLRWPMNRED